MDEGFRMPVASGEEEKGSLKIALCKLIHTYCNSLHSEREEDFMPGSFYGVK